MSTTPYDVEFARLVGRALLLRERDASTTEADYLTPFELEKRIEQWRSTLGYLDDISWQHYLHANGWSQSELPRLAGDTLYLGEHAPAPWITLLMQIWHVTPQADDIAQLQTTFADMPLDDIFLLAPFAPWIRAQFDQHPDIAAHAVHYVFSQLGSLVADQIPASPEQHMRRSRKLAEWSRERWRHRAYQFAWLIRRISHVCVDLCQTILDAYGHLNDDWSYLRQQQPHLPLRPQLAQCTFASAPRAYGRYGGICIIVAQCALIYVPIHAPAVDVLTHCKTWLERRGAPVIVHTAHIHRGDTYYWAHVPPARYLTDAHDIQRFAYNIGALAALADMLGIIGLDHDALYCAGDTPWILDYGHIGYAITHHPPLAHQLVMRAIPTPTQAAINTHLGAWHQHHAIGPYLDEWRDDVLAGYQAYYAFVWQRIDDMRHMIRGMTNIWQRPLQPHTQQIAGALHALGCYTDIRHGFAADLIVEQLVQHHPDAATQIRTALVHGQMPYQLNQASTEGIMTNLGACSAMHQGTQLAHLHMALTPCDPIMENGRAPWFRTTNDILAAEQLVSEALTLADDIIERQCILPYGSGWLTPTHHPRLTPLQISDASIDHGAAGIGMVLAKLGALPDASYLHVVATDALRAALTHAQEHPYQLGAVSWAIAAAAPHIPVTHTLLPRLNSLLRAPLSMRTDHPQWPDGWAGLVIGLAALHAIWPNSGYAMQALTVGEQLLQSRQRNAQGQRTWAGSMLHHGGYGSSGILTALVRLYELSHDQRFLRAANEIAYAEDQHYDEQRGGWPDTRSTPLSHPISWGYGSLGIAMGRLTLMAPLRSRHPDQRLLHLLEALDTSGLPDADGLAEGSAGVIDVMMSVARSLPNPYYEQRAMYWCTQMVARAHDRGGYVCIADIPGVYEHPGVWHGTAGIAYQLARMAYPRLFGSLLAFEMPKSKSPTASDMADSAPQ
ncbi:MAG: DUF4135 domain-containing protein [Chloroflexi bacterium]|nr:DUF4135 domain-containing protein [Chloroflexota bacterium]